MSTGESSSNSPNNPRSRKARQRSATGTIRWNTPNHPYYSKSPKVGKFKTRKFEGCIFTPDELLTMSAKERRITYLASLEAHMDQLHAQLLDLGFWPTPFKDLEPFADLSSETAKSMVSGFHYDMSATKLKLVEIGRMNSDLLHALNAGL